MILLILIYFACVMLVIISFSVVEGDDFFKEADELVDDDDDDDLGLNSSLIDAALEIGLGILEGLDSCSDVSSFTAAAGAGAGADLWILIGPGESGTL
ncbi:hypothetical protein WICPIJ_007032 [Wickerhamomyces pijperi]|uniref:Secreted protein n=1 Tax=Wickerhamomyces pijperi TaxID=599730 RepID=A0A9P8Q2J8_WICPI|nr:hypothetical protein WICPIJ_007032 [Wickerhamomyces pijperi]